MREAILLLSFLVKIVVVFYTVINSDAIFHLILDFFDNTTEEVNY
jgi:hypothetical protein